MTFVHVISRKPSLSRILSAMIAMAGFASPSFANDDAAQVESFYRDKQFRMQVGSAAGSAYDLAARTLAKHIAHHIPGTPSVIVQNVPGAGSFTLANQLYSIAPRDGSVIGAVINGVPTGPLLRPDITRFDPAKFNWIGSINRDSQVFIVSSTSPVQSLEQLRDKRIVVGGTTVGTSNVDFPLALTSVLGLQFRIVSGYESSRYVVLAMERGEVDGNAGTGWSTLNAQSQDQLRAGKIKIIGQYGLNRHPALPDVPLVLDLARSEEERQALSLAFVRQEFGRSYFAPPDVPATRVQALRRAFDATMKDDAFLTEAEKLRLDVEPSTGEELTVLVNAIMNTTPSVASRVRDALEASVARN